MHCTLMGIPNLNDIIKNRDKYRNKKDILTITGAAFKVSSMSSINDSFRVLKKKYWENGTYTYKGIVKEVCFHSREIRKRMAPFSPGQINYNDFIVDLTNLIKETPVTIFSSSIDKVKHVERYSTPDHPYNLSLRFIIERYVKFFLSKHQSGAIILEARTPKSDTFTLNHIKQFLKNGDRYITPEELLKIKGVYFSRKWKESGGKYKSCNGLEVADLCSYPIHKYVKYSTKDRAFKNMENKLHRYPNYYGCGLKVFP